MENSPEATQQSAASKKDVLDAIDYEITHRESMLSRHGLSTWGIIAAICALMWAMTTEALSTPHDFTNVLLVSLAGGAILGLLSSPWTKALGFANFKALSGRTFRELALRAGLEAETVPWFVAQSLVSFSLGVYLGFKGFILLSVTTCGLFFLEILFAVFCWLVLHIQIPLHIPPVSQRRRHVRIVALSWLLVAVLLLVPCDAVLSVWPVPAPDVRLGVMLAALMMLWRISISILKPPTTTIGLREIRTRLAFEEISPKDAKTKAQFILSGTPEEHYLTGKAEEAIFQFREYGRFCGLVASQCEQVIKLAEKFKATDGNETVLKEIAVEFRDSFYTMQRALRGMDKSMEEGVKFRIQLLTRMKLAQSLLSVSAARRETILRDVDESLKEGAKARSKIVEFREAFHPALDLLCTAQRNVKLPPKMTISEAYNACFQA